MIDLDKVLFNLPCAVLVVDTDRRVLLSNRVACELMRQSESRLLHKRGGEVLGCVHADEDPRGCGFSGPCRFCKVKNAIVGALENRRDVPPFEAQMDLKERGRRYFSMTATYLPGSAASGRQPAPSVILTIEDITDLKNRERLAAAHETIGAVCHEMNQPLMAIMGYLEILQSDKAENRFVPDLLAQVRKMGDITRKLQSIAAYTTKDYLGGGSRILDLSGTAGDKGMNA